MLLDVAAAFDEVHGVVRVLLDAGGDGEDVGIEDDVRRGEADLVHQQLVAARADRDLALQGIGLSLLVEGHHHHGCAVAAREPRVRDEFLLAFLQADRVHHGLALHHAQPGLDHVPLRGVDHHRYAADVGFGCHEVQEAVHRGERIEHR